MLFRECSSDMIVNYRTEAKKSSFPERRNEGARGSKVLVGTRIISP